MANGLVTILAVFTYFRITTGKDEQMSYFVPSPGYQFRELPLKDSVDEGPFIVRVHIEIWAITEISLQKQDMQVDLILTISWLDHRLSVNPTLNNTLNWIPIGSEVEKVWTPKLSLRNCNGCPPVQLRKTNDYVMYMQQKTGRLWIQIRSLGRYGCAINLRSYPMDIQRCKIQISTQEDTTDHLILQHYYPEGDRNITSNMTLSEFKITMLKTGNCTFTISGQYTYSCLEIRLQFERLIGYHLTTSYIPTAFIVMISWVAFWLPPDAIPARVALALTSVLTLSTRLDQAQRNLPAVSYTKAFDVWMFACIFLVTTSLLVSSISNYRWRMKLPEDIAFVKPFRTGPLRAQNEKERKHAPAEPKNGTFEDRSARIAFPLTFLIFNIVYWSYYMNTST